MEPILQFFAFEHLPEQLLESKDAAVRAAIFKSEEPR